MSERESEEIEEGESDEGNLIIIIINSNNELKSFNYKLKEKKGRNCKP